MGFQKHNTLAKLTDFEYRTEYRYVLHPQGKRRCKRCQEVKNLSEFSSKGIGRTNSSCKICENKRLAKYRSRTKSDYHFYCDRLIAQLRHRAKISEVPFALTSSDLITLWESQNGL